ncbi:hypothetical protein SAMN05421788_108286 [Filimonas lacunae]|uniref:O-Antigen ligase n=1 Tax=Filimonas lacunae TaxID=477680 RepID=A0A173MDA8_9BACT|nr:hypothetical protein [Filimonas lacunae]BAV05574.1 hypothetical protein FLA_1581 [Filimonas lacunae]SIT29321.1 hypothetical protein SAMN05421788_108286 [Filimonas lacunae]
MHRIQTYIRQWLQQVDGKLLLFLLLLMNVKLVIKLAALAFIYCVRPDFRFRFGYIKEGMPPFYLYIIGIACIDLLLYKGFANTHYLVAFAIAIGFWAACILAVHQLQLAVKMNTTTVLHNTLIAFFTINALVSFAQIAIIMLDAGVINPYRFQGMYQKYFISTGDRIKGISFDTSTTNAVISAAGVIYSLYRRKALLTLLCMVSVLLACSNFTCLMLIVVLLYCFIAASDRAQKSIIICCCTLVIIFMVKVSPQNDDYALKLIRKITTGSSKAPAITSDTVTDTIPPTEEQQRMSFAKHYLDSISQLIARQQLPKSTSTVTTQAAITPLFVARPEIPQPSIHSQPFQRIRDTATILQKTLLTYIKQHPNDNALNNDSTYHLPGKLLAFQQTWQYFQAHPGRLLTGCGPANFSSKLAFRATALNIAGSYPASLSYSHPDFRSHHLAIHLGFFSKDAELHSIANTPNAVYNQVIGEYGIAGLLVFITGYVWFWARRYRILSFGIPILLLTAGVLLMDYWFEQLSVLFVIELLLFVDIKENVCTR